MSGFNKDGNVFTFAKIVNECDKALSASARATAALGVAGWSQRQMSKAVTKAESTANRAMEALSLIKESDKSRREIWEALVALRPEGFWPLPVPEGMDYWVGSWIAPSGVRSWFFGTERFVTALSNFMIPANADGWKGVKIAREIAGGPASTLEVAVEFDVLDLSGDRARLIPQKPDRRRWQAGGLTAPNGPRIYVRTPTHNDLTYGIGIAEGWSGYVGLRGLPWKKGVKK